MVFTWNKVGNLLNFQQIPFVTIGLVDLNLQHWRNNKLLQYIIYFVS